MSELRTVGGTTVYPLYSLPQAANPNYQGQYIGVTLPLLKRMTGPDSARFE